MPSIDRVEVRADVVLGRVEMPIRQLLKMGRGAMIPLGRSCDAPSELVVGGVPIACGTVRVDGPTVLFEVARKGGA